MPRVKRGTTHVKRRRKLLKQAKGYKWGRKKLPRLAKVAVTKAGAYAYRDRKVKKRQFRRLWQIRINAALRDKFETSYSKFINKLKNNKVDIDRKILSDLAMNNPKVFAQIIEKLKYLCDKKNLFYSLSIHFHSQDTSVYL